MSTISMKGSFYLLLTLLTVSCVPMPSPTSVDDSELIPGGFYVVCEGLWRQNNSVVSYVNPLGRVTRDMVSAVNGGLTLGDNASDILSIGDSIIVVVNTSATIERFHRITGRWVDRIALPGGRQPYKIAYDGSGSLYCTLLNDDSIIEIDAKTLKIRVENIHVGPAPIGITTHAGMIYVALSGFGDVRASEPGSGTVSVIRASDLIKVGSVSNVPNASIVVADRARDLLWIGYLHLPSATDSVGGVVVYSTKTQKELSRRYFREVRGLAVDSVTGDGYVLSNSGVSRVTLSGDVTLVHSHTTNSTNDVWYGLNYNASTSLLYVLNARKYVTDGEVIVMRTNGDIVNRFQVGLNPTAVAF